MIPSASSANRKLGVRSGVVADTRVLSSIMALNATINSNYGREPTYRDLRGCRCCSTSLGSRFFCFFDYDDFNGEVRRTQAETKLLLNCLEYRLPVSARSRHR